MSKRHQHRLLQQIVNGDEKWVLYVDHTRKRQWVNPEDLPEPEPKNYLHPKKVILSMWWDFQGIAYRELLSGNTTIDAKLYCQRLEKVKAALQVNHLERQNIWLLHDSARPKTAKVTRQNLEELEWEILLNSPYSPDPTPSDYHLFRPLRNHLGTKCFDDEADLQ